MSPTLGPTQPLHTPRLAPLYHSVSASTEAVSQKDVIAKDVCNAGDVVLDARQYKIPAFAQQLVQLLATLRVPSWSSSIPPHAITIYRVSGSLTNAVFFIKHSSAQTVLLRIYGPSSGELISRTQELHILHILSSQYSIGPRVYGTFANGRIEEYFASSALTAQSIRDPTISAWIGMRMAELHSVDLSRVELKPGSDHDGVRRNIRHWLGPASEVLRRARDRGHPLAGAPALDLDAFSSMWERYWGWLMEWERTHGASPRVFAHNDAQYGNLLRLDGSKSGAPAHHSIIVVDFEYASANAAAFDIANHFHEWTADYHGATPHLLRGERYPAVGARRNYYVAYLSAGLAGNRAVTEAEVDALDAAVEAWSAASHAMWGIWGIVQAGEDVGRGAGTGEFDYLGYAACRLALFREAAAATK